MFEILFVHSCIGPGEPKLAPMTGVLNLQQNEKPIFSMLVCSNLAYIHSTLCFTISSFQIVAAYQQKPLADNQKLNLGVLDHGTTPEDNPFNCLIRSNLDYIQSFFKTEGHKKLQHEAEHSKKETVKFQYSETWGWGTCIWSWVSSS